MYLSVGLRFFYKICFRQLGLDILVLIPIQWYEYASRYDTASYSNLTAMIVAH